MEDMAVELVHKLLHINVLYGMLDNVCIYQVLYPHV